MRTVDKMSKLLGERTFKGEIYKYFLGSDNYVYTYINGQLDGWLCSFTSWDNALHRILRTKD